MSWSIYDSNSYICEYDKEDYQIKKVYVIIKYVLIILSNVIVIANLVYFDTLWV